MSSLQRYDSSIVGGQSSDGSDHDPDLISLRHLQSTASQQLTLVAMQLILGSAGPAAVTHQPTVLATDVLVRGLAREEASWTGRLHLVMGHYGYPGLDVGEQVVSFVP